MAKKFFNKIAKISLFDLTIILVFFLIVLSFSVFFFRKNVYLTIQVKITDDNILWASNNPPYWFTYLLHKGMKEKDGLSRPQAEVTDVLIYNTEPTKKAAYLTVKLKTVYDKRKSQYSYRGKPILIGTPIKFNFEELGLEGLITHIQGVADTKEEELEVEGRLSYESPTFPDTYGIPPYVATAFNIGDKSYDSQGRVVAEILDKQVFPADKVVTDTQGNVLLRKDPIRKAVFLRLKIMVKKVNNELYFLDTHRVAINESLPLQLEKIMIWPTITLIN